MGLSQLLNDSLNSSELSDDKGSWRQFILDHLTYITERTKPTDIDKLLINQYRYDLVRFLKERLGIQNDIAWIVLLLNDLGSDLDFSEPGEYIIPTDDLITSLYHIHRTTARNSN